MKLLGRATRWYNDYLIQVMTAQSGAREYYNQLIIAPASQRKRIITILDAFEQYADTKCYRYTKKYLRGFVYHNIWAVKKRPSITPWIWIDDGMFKWDIELILFSCGRLALELRAIKLGCNVGYCNNKIFAERCTKIALKKFCTELRLIPKKEYC